MSKHSFNIARGARKQQPEGDASLGLTEAFAPIGAGDALEHRGAADGDTSLGLTEAFAPVAASRGVHAAGFKYQGDTSEDYSDPVESLEPRDEPVFGDEVPAAAPVQNRGRHGKLEPVEHPHLKKSRRVRRVLVIIVALLVVLACALGYFAFQLWNESSRAMVQQTQAQQQSTDVGNLSQDNSGKDAASATTAKKTEVPNLVGVLGQTQDAAITALAHGATVTSSKDVNEEGNAVKKRVTVALTAEPADSRSGTPTVYLGLDADGKVIQAGYSAATASLGYGSLSFADAVKNEHIVEKTLRERDGRFGQAALRQNLVLHLCFRWHHAGEGELLVQRHCGYQRRRPHLVERAHVRLQHGQRFGQPGRHRAHHLYLHQCVASNRRPNGRRCYFDQGPEPLRSACRNARAWLMAWGWSWVGLPQRVSAIGGPGSCPRLSLLVSIL